MSKPKFRRPSAGLVLGALALIVAVAGNSGAFAGTKVIVRKGQIEKGAVGAKALAKGAVHPAAIAKGAVGVAALRPGSVNSTVLAPDAVTGGALAPGSVYGGALGEVTLHSAAIVDADAVPHDLGMDAITDSDRRSAHQANASYREGWCSRNPGNGRVGIITSQPFVNGGQNGWAGTDHD